MAEMSKMSSFARLKLLTYLGYLILLTIYVLCLVISHIHAAPTCPRNVGINKVGFCLSNRSFYEWECMQCPHGLGQSIQCGRIYYELLKVHCVPCENGTSYSNSNDNGQCIKCKKCQENELKSGQCLPDKDTTKCVCKLGYYRDRGHCKPCSWCCGDKSNDHVEECKHLEKKCSYNAKSCDPTTTSAPTTTADPTTLAPKTTVPTAKQPRTEESQNKSYPFTNDSEKTVTPNDSKKTEKEHSGGKKSEKNGLVLQILLSFIVVVLIILLALVIYCCCKRRSNSSDGGSNENSSSTSNASSLAPLLNGKPVRDVNSNKSGEHVDLKPSDDSSATSHAKSKGNSSDGGSSENSGSTSYASSPGNSADGGSGENSGSTSNASSSATLLPEKKPRPVGDNNSNTSEAHVVNLQPSDSSAKFHAKSKACNEVEPLLPAKRLNKVEISFICETLGEKIGDLKHDVTVTLCKMLNIPIHDKDYRNLDRFCKLSYWDKKGLEKKESPMEDIIDLMASELITLESFVNELYEISRGDVVQTLYDMAIRKNSIGNHMGLGAIWN